MANPRLAQRSFDRANKSQFAAAIAATGGTPRVVQIEHHEQVYNGLPLLDPLVFGGVMGLAMGVAAFSGARMAEVAAGAVGSGLPGSVASMAFGCMALAATVWRTKLLVSLAQRVAVETATFEPAADDKPARRHFNVDRRTVHVLSDAEETWRDRLAWLAEEIPGRGDAFTVRDWTPAENGFSRNEWDRLRAELVARGWLDNTSRLTSPGRAVMRDWRDNPLGATVTAVARAMAGQPPPPQN